MKRAILLISIILLLSLAFSGCTLRDETVRMVATGHSIIEDENASVPLYGILNLTIYNDYSKTLLFTEHQFLLKGHDVSEAGKRSHPKLFILNFTIVGNASSELPKGESRSVSIEHIMFERVQMDDVTYEYEDVVITFDLKEEEEMTVVMQPSFFKTNYFIFTIVFVGTLIMLAAMLGRKQKAPAPAKNLCRFCLDDLSKMDDKKKFYCKMWKTRTKRCGEGPFCSERCLNYHQEDVSHEN